MRPLFGWLIFLWQQAIFVHGTANPLLLKFIFLPIVRIIVDVVRYTLILINVANDVIVKSRLPRKSGPQPPGQFGHGRFVGSND
jgi:hypothetical protein